MICSCCGKHKKPVGLEGMGTALKPAMELIAVARKPLSESTIAKNILRWGTGAINIDATRIEAPGVDLGRNNNARTDGTSYVVQREAMRIDNSGGLGRFPANLCHDGSQEVLAAFPSPHGAGAACDAKFARGDNLNVYGKANVGASTGARHGDSGSAARFFYSAKASKADRALSKHPTVKPVKLMQWLVRLITPPGGVTLDPFAGTGTTGEAAWREGFSAVLVEREEEYQADIERRMLFAKARPKAEAKPAVVAADDEVDTLDLLPLCAPLLASDVACQAT